MNKRQKIIEHRYFASSIFGPGHLPCNNINIQIIQHFYSSNKLTKEDKQSEIEQKSINIVFASLLYFQLSFFIQATSPNSILPYQELGTAQGLPNCAWFSPKKYRFGFQIGPFPKSIQLEFGCLLCAINHESSDKSKDVKKDANCRKGNIINHICDLKCSIVFFFLLFSEKKFFLKIFCQKQKFNIFSLSRLIQ